MQDEQNVVNEQEEVSEDYIDIIKNMKENSVSKEEFMKVKEDNKRLLEMVANGETLPEQEQQESNTEKISRLRKELFSEGANLDNLDYIKKSVELREAILDETGEDIFLPNGSQYNPTTSDKESVEKTVKIFKDCIERSQGDSGVFTSLLQSYIPNDIVRKGR